MSLLTTKMKYRLAGIWAFSMIWIFAPSDVLFWPPLVWTLTVIFWFIFALCLSALTLSKLIERYWEDEPEERD